MFQTIVARPRMEDLLWMYEHASANEEAFRNILHDCAERGRLPQINDPNVVRNLHRSPLPYLFDAYVNIEGQNIHQVEFYVLGDLKQTHANLGNRRHGLETSFHNKDKALIAIGSLGRGFHSIYHINDDNSVIEIEHKLSWMS